MFRPATKEKSKLRLALMGPSGSGKTYTALTFATTIGKKVAVIDSERGSASKYADLFSFDTCDLESHSPQTYVNAIREAEKAGYDVLVIDSLSHAWSGKDGALEQVDKVAKRSQSGNSFTAWREVTPMHNALVDAILQSGCHVIATMRTKQEYVLEENERGKKTPRKVGMAPVQREGVEYEFDVIADMNIDHDFIVAKTRCAAIDGLVARKPGEEIAQTLADWVNSGAPAPKPEPTAEGQSGQVSASAEKKSAGGASKSGSTSTSETSLSDSPAKPTQESATGAQSTSSPKSGSDSAESSEKPLSAVERAAAKAAEVKKVTKTEMSQLLQLGKTCGWDTKKIGGFICSEFKLTPATVTDLTFKQWETVTRLLSRPENKDGKIVVDDQGKALSADKQWPRS